MSSPALVTDHEADLIQTATATFSPDRAYRYRLTRTWDSSSPYAAFVMLNPSTADAFTADPTIRRCVSFARSWGAGGLVVLNLFALRSTDPKALYGHPDPVGPDNDAVIAETFAHDDFVIGPTVVAWGVHGTLHGRGDRVAALLRARAARVTCLGTTRDGHPRHPLYLAANTAGVAYREAITSA